MYQFVAELNRRTGQHFKVQYFCWKHGLNTKKRKYAGLTEEELRAKFKEIDRHWKYLQNWEKSLEYAEWHALYLEWKAKEDFLQIYESVRDKALQGDERAIKLFLQLQKELKKLNKAKKTDDDDVSPIDDIDDDLKLTIP